MNVAMTLLVPVGETGAKRPSRYDEFLYSATNFPQIQ